MEWAALVSNGDFEWGSSRAGCGGSRGRNIFIMRRKEECHSCIFKLRETESSKEKITERKCLMIKEERALRKLWGAPEQST
jgi:hypothetical protein